MRVNSCICMSIDAWEQCNHTRKTELNRYLVHALEQPPICMIMHVRSKSLLNPEGSTLCSARAPLQEDLKKKGMHDQINVRISQALSFFFTSSIRGWPPPMATSGSDTECSDDSDSSFIHVQIRPLDRVGAPQGTAAVAVPVDVCGASALLALEEDAPVHHVSTRTR